MVSFSTSSPSAVLAAAGQSSMSEPLRPGRPWLRFVGFILLASAVMFAVMVIFALAGVLIPALGDHLFNMSSPVDDSPLRLIDESIVVGLFGLALASLALSMLVAAAFVWRVPLTSFLWPGRTFDVRLFGLGFLTMVVVFATWMLVDVVTGGLYRSPVLDAYYPVHSRVIYVLAMAAGLLAGAAAEEVALRGVLLRLSGLITRRAIVLCVINGLVFSALHLDPDPVAFIARALSGMGWTWAALRLGGLEFSIGAHFANNLSITLFSQPFSSAVQTRTASFTELIPEMVVAAFVVIVVECIALKRAGPAAHLSTRATT